jgi:hypothetical protein
MFAPDCRSILRRIHVSGYGLLFTRSPYGKIAGMRVLSLRRKSRLPIWAPALFLCFGVQSLFCRPAGLQQSSSFEDGGVQDVEQSLGRFAVPTVRFRWKKPSKFSIRASTVPFDRIRGWTALRCARQLQLRRRCSLLSLCHGRT